MSRGGLGKWFSENWTRDGGSKPCGRSSAEKKAGEPYPKCLPKDKWGKLSSSEKSSAIARKRAANNEREGKGNKPVNVKTRKGK